MKTFVTKTANNSMTIFENVNNGMKATKKARTTWRKEYHSLSRLLRDLQLKSAMKTTAEVFESMGLPTTGKVRPADILDICEMVEDAKGNKFPAYMTQCTVMKEVVVEGRTVRIPKLDPDGKKEVAYKLRPVKDGQWTLDKLVQIVLTARNMYA